MKESNYKGKVYNFTNENLVAYQNIYNFNNTKVLSAIGSGDQYFSSLLYGAKNIDLYDINLRSWDYFILKYYSILTLSYEEFYNFFIISNLDDVELYNKVRYYLPEQIKNNLDNFIKENKSLSKIIISNTIYNTCSSNLSIFIPYFQKEKYYELKNKLLNQNLPKVYFYNLMDLSNILNNEEYDLMLTSNIYSCLGINIEEYKQLLSDFKANTIQANYYWLHQPKEKITENGFELCKIESVFKNRNDYILTLKKDNNIN